MKGCNIGLRVYPQQTGLYPMINNPHNELYAGTPINIINSTPPSSGCGIQNAYSFTGQQCVVQNPSGGYYFGNVIDYTTTDVVCTPIDSIIFILIPIILIAFKKIRKSWKNIETKYN